MTMRTQTRLYSRRALLQQLAAAGIGALGLLLPRPARGSGIPQEAVVIPNAAVRPSSLVETWQDGTTFVVLPQANLSEEKSSRIAFHVYFLVGQADDVLLPGLRALLVRAWGRETESRSALLLQNDIGIAGGAMGASLDTSGDGVHVYAQCRSDEQSIADCAKTFFTDIVASPRFGNETVARAQAVLSRDRLLFRDALADDALHLLRAKIWDRSQYSYPRLGDTPVWKLAGDKLTAFYRRHFAPSRAVVVVAGDIGDLDAMRRTVRASLNAGGWNDRQNNPTPPMPVVPAETVPASLAVRPLRLVRPGSAPSALIMAGVLLPGVRTSPETLPTLLIVDALLGASKGGQMFRVLRDAAGIGYNARTDLQAARAQSLLTLHIAGRWNSEEQIQSARQSLLGVLKTDADALLSSGRLERAKSSVIGRLLRETERLPDRARMAAWAQGSGAGAGFVTDFPARIAAVTREKVADVLWVVRQSEAVTVVTRPAQDESTIQATATAD